MADYKPNSHKSKEEAANAPVKREVQKVVSGKVKRKENKTRKFTDIFISEDIDTVKSHLFEDVLIPAAKKLVSDIVRDGIDMLLYGRAGGSKKNSTSKVSYRNYYEDRGSNYSGNSNNAPKVRFDYDDIEFASRMDAEAVLEQMRDTVDRYGLVSVADMYDMAGESAPHTAHKIGWTNIRAAEVTRVRDGFIIKLPKAVPLD